MHEAAVQDLRAFNRLADRVSSSSFLAHMREEGTGLQARRRPDGFWDFYDMGPEGENTDSALLAIRQVLLKREPVYFERIVDHFSRLPADAATRAAVAEVWANLAVHLNSPVALQPKDQMPTRREVLDVFLYGGLVHSDHDKAGRLARWKQNPAVFLLLYEEYLHALADIADVIEWQAARNREALDALGPV